MNIDKFLVKAFDRQRYNCWHFAREVWRELTGTDIPLEAVQTERFTELACPESPCLVLFERARHEPHVGVYLDGRVLHLNQRGAEYRALSSVSASWTKVRYYR